MGLVMEIPILSLFLLSSAAWANPSAEAGKTTFSTFCATCHGDTGKGDGIAGQALEPNPADFTDPAFWKARDDVQIKNAITNGGASVGKSPLMAPWGPVIGEEGVESVLLYLKASFKPKE